MRILIVEDATDMAEAVVARLVRYGMACDLAATVQEARCHLEVQRYDAMVLDINLPDGLGTDLLREMRNRGDRTPVLMLTALFSVDDRVSALDLGADDYLVKPFDHRELEARVRALLRRETDKKSDVLTISKLSFYPATLTAEHSGNWLDLARREAALLGQLMRHPRQILSKERLYEGLYSFDDVDVGLNAIELYIGRLRKKINGSGAVIETQRGLGYRIVESA